MLTGGDADPTAPVPEQPSPTWSCARIATAAPPAPTLLRVEPHADHRKAPPELMPVQSYTAPLADFRFLLQDVFDYPRE